MSWPGMVMVVGEGLASCSRPVPPGLRSAQALGSSLPPPSSCRTPDPVHGLKKCQTLDTPHIEVLFLGLEVGQEGVRCGDKGLVS